jgi:GNAT superfamily N-acetyltransferase
MSETGPQVRSVTDEERPELVELLTREWGSPRMVSRGQEHDASRSPAVLYIDEGRVLGVATYEVSGRECQLLTIDAFEKSHGIGSRLLEAVIERARVVGCRRLWLVTTNDNIDAIRFYQRRGLRLAAVHPGAVDQSRRLKPSIPEIGHYGIPIRDELEFELALAG